MAAQIKAVQTFRPRLSLGPSVGLKDIVSMISARTGLNKGELQNALSELSEVVQFYNKKGQGVKLDGLGTYLPTINIKGKFSISHRLDKEIENALNTPGAYSGKIINKENIGKTKDDLIALWNEAYPDDPVA